VTSKEHDRLQRGFSFGFAANMGLCSSLQQLEVHGVKKGSYVERDQLRA
jgi:hypothetical protein